MNRGTRLYHFYPGRPAFDSVDDTNEICSVTGERRKCSILVTGISRTANRTAFGGPGQRRREPPVVARARAVGCRCDVEAAIIEVSGKVAGTRLDDLLATVEVLRARLDQSPIWLELRAVLLPGATDADRHVDLVTTTLFDRLGPDIPLHLTTVGIQDDDERRSILQHARWIGVANGLRWVYTDDATDPSARCTWCPGCDALLLDHRDPVSRIVGMREGRCATCGWEVPGRFPPEALAA